MDKIYSILQSIGFDWQVALANLVNFLIIVWIIKRFAWKPIQAKLGERQSLIIKGLEDAQNAEKNLRDAEAQSSILIKKAHDESSVILASAHDDRKNIIAVAEKDAVAHKDSLRRDAEKTIDKYKEEEMKAFKGEASVLFHDIAQKILAQELTDEAKQAYAKKSAQALNQ